MATYTDPTSVITTGSTEPVQPGVRILLIGSLLTVLVAGALLWNLRTTRANTAKTQVAIDEKRQELRAYESTARELNTLSNQSANLRLLFTNQRRWPAVLDEVAKRLHRDMAVTSLQATDKGELTLIGIVPDYVTYAKVFRAFTDEQGQKFFTQVRPTAVSKVGTEGSRNSYVTFTYTLTIAPDVLTAGNPLKPAAH